MNAGVPRLLAIDTATEACSAALRNGDALLERYEEVGRGHAERILVMVDSLLTEAAVTLQQLDAIAVGRGPGAFTGVRLAISVAQGLAFGAGRPVVPVSDLRAIAQRAFELRPKAQTCLVCSDARMREVYSARFRRDATGLAVATGGETGGGPDTVDWRGLEASAGATVCAGRGFRVYGALGERAAALGLEVLDDLLPSAAAIARLALADLGQGLAVPATAVVPVYLRERVAEPPSRN
jgi:tRNA threonylcarbamoyladenosine biosynthesis protein TsaB